MANSQHVFAIIQARMGSSRLPGKVLADITGLPMLARVVERTRRATTVDHVVVATTTEVEDDAVTSLCTQRGYDFFRGSLHNVLDRFYQAALLSKAEIVVRITADCPVIDPELIDETVNILSDQSKIRIPQSGIDFAANRLPPPWGRTYPIGLDVEACTFTALERAWKEADQSFQREHVMPYLYEGVELAAVSPRLATGFSSRGFGIALLNHVPDYGGLRWTVDTRADLEFIRQIYTRFGSHDDFSWHEVLTLLQHEPELSQINANVTHKTAFDVDARRVGG